VKGRKYYTDEDRFVGAVLRTYRQSATATHRKFEIDFFFVREIIKQNCFYCGALPAYAEIVTEARKQVFTPGYKNGIDRFINSEGYTENNCVPCCWQCNRMKGSMDGEEFLEHIQKIKSKHQE
jgi:hypothetical protein